jgi:hypothetical protein
VAAESPNCYIFLAQICDFLGLESNAATLHMPLGSDYDFNVAFTGFCQQF